jgi:tetratricopeptide (TPR) repeat protein
MQACRLLPGAICVLLLSACATANLAPPARPQVTLGTVLSDADSALKAGQNDKAVQLLRSATSAYPADKAPWLKMAQLRFETGSYGEAISSAQEALERDPDDTLANSIVAVSGLRVASKALADLTQKNNLTGTVRSEAQDLAKLLRESLGETTLVKAPQPRIPARANKPPPSPVPAAGSSKPSNPSDPFGQLR